MLHILTLNWQGREKVEKLRTSLLPALRDIDYVWHIRDNGSTDGSIETIKEWNDPQCHLIPFPHNRENYAQGMNSLFQESGASGDDVVMTLNNDILINDTVSISNMLALLNVDSEIGLVGAKLNYTGTKKIQHCGVLFSRTNRLPYHYRAGLPEAPRDTTNRYYPAVTGAVAMLRADTFANCAENKSGRRGFDEGFHFAFEDIDMSMRITHHLKKRNVYCGQTEIYHEESASLKKNPVHKMFFHQNCNIFLERWAPLAELGLEAKYANENYELYKV